jgi:hypothetical protein
MASVYVEEGDASALDDACDRLRKSITMVRPDTGTVVEILIVGDFNRHDQLWGGDVVSLGRQGEADPIIDLMNECALSSLLKRGTKTWHGGGQSGDCESTIDLVLASKNLTDSMVKCEIHGTEHGSYHRAIETVFDAPWPVPKHRKRLLLKNAPWKEINARIASTRAATPSEGTVQQKTDRLMSAVWQAVHALTPKIKPSPHAKRWWITLRHSSVKYTHAGGITPALNDGQDERHPTWKRGPKVRQNNTTMPSGNKRQSTGMSSLQTMITYGKPLNIRSQERMQHSGRSRSSSEQMELPPRIIRSKQNNCWQIFPAPAGQH